MEIWVIGGSKIGRVTAELFTDIVPKTCQLFLSLIKGDAKGHTYMGTRLFRIVPNLYCRGGDVTKDNGFGCYLPEGETELMTAENFKLNHTVPGGPTQALERISALGLPLGTTTSDCVVRYCGWFTRNGQYREGLPNTIKFPPRRKAKK